ncbi:MAG: hypothetical protein CO156_03060 [Candidatus Pacebacteria bacterium CG_4_9_14_3_um_filter_40_12]|nr:MAG: hypothetical protein COU64_00670 [Candidatus Pacebacteria bacterium CG10_big_fil_rev_8_21_14_0_10_40_26]PIZ79260.1 MAG: hypothetical protein COY01_02450 [Candidatus Pacebacteria bacterium CG_4_10_14_0_2_um_filter_40_20]PJA68916.1 MAG: hypothetical protein CO156_03060 [Candidatus Pacebacteria bacterium CG_4_9_14_3_um_filter_40_12]PJC42227.1 MAG: hypothetical protein CO041_01160 [Candidatus Pacebacteria bacterium CG_4_9_14_0_2_um_filter_40_15]
MVTGLVAHELTERKGKYCCANNPTAIKASAIKALKRSGLRVPFMVIPFYGSALAKPAHYIIQQIIKN